MTVFGENITIASAVFLFLALGLALAFEFANGFHDTANAVATVIYTHTLKPTTAVVWSGLWNFLGVLTSSGIVAFGILALLPVELVLNVGSAAGFAMVFALLLAAIIWNVGTWYFGIPASSSHTLIGSILGVGMANAVLVDREPFGAGVNWSKATEVFSSLLISPLFGFGVAAGLLLLCKALVRNPALYRAPEGEQPPPLWIRAILVFTCTGVSFAHGSNDGQKGMGLILLILIGILPGAFALNAGMDGAAMQALLNSAEALTSSLNGRTASVSLTKDEAVDEISRYVKRSGVYSERTYAAITQVTADVRQSLLGKQSLADVAPADRRSLRSSLYLLDEAIIKLSKTGKLPPGPASATILDFKKHLDSATRYIPTWVKIAVALALGLGTMIGWKRIVVTVGEKIGKDHLTYAQGAAAELVAMGTIGAADVLGLPVSTTHVLSSGVAGTMAANRSGLQMDTVRSLALAWVLTLPVSMSLSAGIYWLVLSVMGGGSGTPLAAH